jgi:prepilin-type N-terminal cleavage/methylation domain-containing protein
MFFELGGYVVSRRKKLTPTTRIKIMNSQFKTKLIQHLSNKKDNKGFTLIELLVVVIIIGVLAAIALPNLLGQVAKGRQAEAKTQLGALNRAQQSYRLEEGTFGKITDLDVKVSGQYYEFRDTGTTPTATLSAEAGTASADAKKAVGMQADAKEVYEDDIKNYASAVYQGTDGTQTVLICEDLKPIDDAVTINLTTDAVPTCGAFKPVNK